jgi:hypothetical protein
MLALVVLVVAAFVPGVLTMYRCSMTGAAMAAPCCPHKAHERARAQREPAAPAIPELRAASCCAKLSVSTESAPAMVASSETGQAPVAVVPAAAPERRLVSAIGLPQVAWTRAHFDSGAPIRLRYCSLLI